MFKILAPAVSAFLMVIAITVLIVDLPFYLESLGYSKIMIGIISSIYYSGIVVGSFKIENLVSSIGHIRSFAAFISITIVTTLIPIIFNVLINWIIFRFIAGISIAGLYIVLESWFLSVATQNTRGTYLSIYMAALGLGSSLAPFLMIISNNTSLVIFLITVILFAVSSFSLTIQRGPIPEITSSSMMTLVELFKISKVGVAGALLSGFMTSGMQSLFPLLLTSKQFGITNTVEISTIVSTLISGNFCFQYPVGYISDKYDRRKLLLVLSIIGTISYICAIVCFFGFSLLYLIIIFIIGGCIFSLYPIAISFTCDQINQNDIIKVIQAMLLVYGFGSALGPLVLSFSLKVFGANSVFIINAFLLFIFTIYLAFNIMIGYNKIAPIHIHTIIPTTTPVITESAAVQDVNKMPTPPATSNKHIEE